MKTVLFTAITSVLWPVATMACLLPLLSLTALGAQEDDFVYQTSGGAAVITGYAGAGGAVVVPDTLGGLPVRTIGALAFEEETTVTSVSIPNSVTNIAVRGVH